MPRIVKGCRRPVAEHGTTSMYATGCRCAPCSDAQRAYDRWYYATWKKPRLVKAGVLSGRSYQKRDPQQRSA